MRPHKEGVIKATDKLVEFLARRSQEVDQETRITVYLFDTGSDCVIYDKDVLRMPSLKTLYTSDGTSTNLIGATSKSLDEAKDISERYGDHAFLFYVLTDGLHNSGGLLPRDLLMRIQAAPDNYTLATLVPDRQSMEAAVSYGFPRENIQIWDTAGSFEEVGKEITKSTETYFQARAAGIRGTKNLFTMDLGNLSKTAVKRNLVPLRPEEYSLYTVKRTSPISEFVSFYEGAYIKGKSFYELVKPETIQPQKAVAIQDRTTGEIYVGSQARSMLGLPDYEIKVNPDTHPKFKVFIQSTSVNRKLLKGNQVLVMKSVWT